MSKETHVVVAPEFPGFNNIHNEHSVSPTLGSSTPQYYLLFFFSINLGSRLRSLENWELADADSWSSRCPQPEIWWRIATTRSEDKNMNKKMMNFETKWEYQVSQTNLHLIHKYAWRMFRPFRRGKREIRVLRLVQPPVMTICKHHFLLSLHVSFCRAFFPPRLVFSSLFPYSLCRTWSQPWHPEAGVVALVIISPGSSVSTTCQRLPRSHLDLLRGGITSYAEVLVYARATEVKNSAILARALLWELILICCGKFLNVGVTTRVTGSNCSFFYF